MVQKAYKIHQLTIDADTIKGISDSNISSGIETFMMQGGGSLDPFHAVSTKADEMATFATSDLKVALDRSGMTPYKITGTGASLAKLYCRQLADGGVFTGGANDMSFIVNKGLVYLKSISAQQFATATAQYEVIPTFDGTNSPIVISDVATAPTLSRDDSLWTIGKVVVNGTAIPVVSINYDSGFLFDKKGSDGFLFNTEVFTLARNPTFTIGIHDVSRLKPAGISPLIGAYSGGSVIVYLRKYLNGGGMVPDGTAEHIKFTMTGAQITSQGVTAQSGATANLELKITPIYDATNAIIVIDTASVIA